MRQILLLLEVARLVAQGAFRDKDAHLADPAITSTGHRAHYALLIPPNVPQVDLR